MQNSDWEPLQLPATWKWRSKTHGPIFVFTTSISMGWFVKDRESPNGSTTETLRLPRTQNLFNRGSRSDAAWCRITDQGNPSGCAGSGLVCNETTGLCEQR